MRRLRSLGLAVTLALPVVATTGCELIAGLRGLVSAARELETHLKSDLEAPLTDEKITLLLEVTPALTEFSKTAEHKWKPDPTANDFSKLAQNLGALSDYMAFFEGHGTRITEFYVLLIKVHDARAQVLWRRAYDEAVKTHEAERAALSAKLEGDVSDEERKRLEKELERNKLAREKLDEAAKAQEEAIAARRQAAPEKHGYTLSDAEVARVEARIDEINAVFKEAGFDKKDPPLPKAVEVKDP